MHSGLSSTNTTASSKIKMWTWNEVGTRYRAAIQPDWTQVQFFDHCAAMLRNFATATQPVVVVRRKLLPQSGGATILRTSTCASFSSIISASTITPARHHIYKYLEDRKVGYVYYSTFAGAPSHSFIDMMLISMKDADGPIIDVRNNGGGDISNVGHWVSHFIDKKTLGGYISHKTGRDTTISRSHTPSTTSLPKVMSSGSSPR